MLKCKQTFTISEERSEEFERTHLSTNVTKKYIIYLENCIKLYKLDIIKNPQKKKIKNRIC